MVTAGPTKKTPDLSGVFCYINGDYGFYYIFRLPNKAYPKGEYLPAVKIRAAFGVDKPISVGLIRRPRGGGIALVIVAEEEHLAFGQPAVHKPGRHRAPGYVPEQQLRGKGGGVGIGKVDRKSVV